MRKNRVIEQNRCYHLVSRLAHRAFFLDDEEKDRAVALMRRIEAGVQAIMSYCINRAVSISSDLFDPLLTLFKPTKVKKMALLLSSNSPNVYDGAIGQYKSMCTFFKFEDAGIVTAKADEQKTEATREKILELVKSL